MILFYVLEIVIIFALLAMVSEEYFIPAIDIIAKKLKLSSDAAGATLLAIGSSAPEFFTALFAVFGASTADIGSGTIVGSAMFNILVIVGASALFKAVTLQWKPVLRDMIFYVFTILLLLIVFWDGKVVFYESLSFVGLYVVYVIAVSNWRKWFKYDDVPAPKHVYQANRVRYKRLILSVGDLILKNPAKKASFYIWTFVASLGAIALLSHYLVTSATNIADILSINPTVLALTVLAAGTSVPDLIGSVVVAKQGRGDMAVGNAVGSNVFDILMGLGLPWLLYLSIHGGYVPVSKDNLFASVLLLFASVLSLLFLMIARKWRLGSKSGLVLIMLYVAYIIYVLSKI